MAPTNPTTSTKTTMGAKLVGVLGNHTRPKRSWWACKKLGKNIIKRIGVSEPTRCLFLADDGSLKWIAVNAGVFPGRWSFSPRKASRLVFPPFPTGPWNLGQIRRLKNGEVGFEKTLEVPLDGIDSAHAWHHTKIEFTELQNVTYSDNRVDGRIFHAKHPQFEGKNLFVKIDPWLGQYSKKAMVTEIKAYQLLEGLDIAPNFLGHVTYNGAMIGLILEMVEGAQTTEKEDELARIKAVKKLHDVKIVHGCAHHLNFLKVGQEKMLIIDFEEAKFGDDATLKRKEEDIRRIGDFEKDMYGPIDDDDDESDSEVKTLFDDMEDDDINWTDDSEADNDSESGSESDESSFPMNTKATTRFTGAIDPMKMKMKEGAT
ncbi:hypothetical protein F5Y01DRAFT_329801 [Xylaria sp. FL0043]|nr:hypothetical protein F5Y01DRAFT_329801 [Xylaria sp. FL0043]